MPLNGINHEFCRFVNLRQLSGASSIKVNGHTLLQHRAFANRLNADGIGISTNQLAMSNANKSIYSYQ
jgi:hypothetical protein